jgi:hypothetical protein
MKLLPLIASACLATSAVAAGAPNIEQQVGRAVGQSLPGDGSACAAPSSDTPEIFPMNMR